MHDETSSNGYAASNMTYVVTLTDPDAPSRDDPKWSEMCHWIAVLSSHQIQHKTGHSFDLTISDDDEIIPYKPPGPPEKTGKHRYVLLVFVPANGTTEGIYPSKPKDRKHWGYGGPDENGGKTRGVRDWAGENGLAVVGMCLVLLLFLLSS